jgi:hypothetical protein
MTTKAAFTEQEWDLVRAGPPAAGMMVITASHGGMVRETFEMAKAYADARQEHGESELLDELVSAKPERDHTRYHSVEELKEHSLQRLREAVELLQTKATPEEVEDYRRFILTVTDRVAKRHREEGVQVSVAEQQAIDEVRAVLAGPSA